MPAAAQLTLLSNITVIVVLFTHCLVALCK